MYSLLVRKRFFAFSSLVLAWSLIDGETEPIRSLIWMREPTDGETVSNSGSN